MTRKVVSPIALDRSINTTEQTPRNIADVLAQQLAAIKTAIESGNGNLEAAFVCYYGVTTATQIKNAIEDGKVPYFYYNGSVAQLWKVETDKYTFRTTSTRSVEGQTILDVVDYVVNGSVWSTVTREVSGGSSSGQSYIASVNSLADFDTTGKSGMQDLVSVANVPADGVYQVSVMLHITPKTASATKSDLVLQFTSSDNTGWPSHTFHAVVDDSQTFAQQLSFSTSVSLKAGENTLRIQCGGLNTEYLVFVEELTLAQLVNGVYHNGDDFDEVHTLPEAADFNNDDGVLVDGATGGPRFMLWRTLANKVLGFIKSLSTTITAFRTGDVIPVDGPSGTAKMSKDDLLKETAESGLVATKADLDATNLSLKDVEERTENLHDYGENIVAVTDPNGYIGFAVDKIGNLIGVFFNQFKESTEYRFVVTDPNGFIGFAVDNYGNLKGASLEHFKESTENGFVVTDPNGYIGFSVDNEGNTTFKEKIDNDISLVLPSKIPVVQDRVNFFYYENILKNGWIGDGILVNSNNNTNHDSNVFKVGVAGTKTITYNAYEGEKIVASKSFNRVTISKAQAGSFKVCVLGDSKTDNASKLAQLLNICQQDGYLSVTLLGSITENYEDADGNSRSVKNEGYSGSKVQNFCRSETFGGHTNIFYDSTIAETNKFSFTKGVTALGDVPDILWIDLGANQANDSKSDVMGCYESIIQSVKDYNTANSTNVKVVISVQEFGGCLPYVLSNGNGKAFLNSSKVKVEDYIQEFDNRESEGVFICPQYVCIDPFNDYPMTDIPESLGIGNGPTRRVTLDFVHPGVNTEWYNAATTYNVGSICKTTNKVMALCLKDGTVGITPTDDKVNWALTIGDNANLGYFKLAEMYFAVLKYIASI